MEKITTSQFHELVYSFIDEKTQQFNGKLPCIVDFYADWCGPCKLLTPALEQISEAYKDRINVYKVNVEEEYALTERYKIKSIPVLMFCPSEGEPQISHGAMPKTAIQAIIEDFLLKQK